MDMYKSGTGTFHKGSGKSVKQPGINNMTDTGKAGSAVGISNGDGYSGPIIRSGAPKRD